MTGRGAMPWSTVQVRTAIATCAMISASSDWLKRRASGCSLRRLCSISAPETIRRARRAIAASLDRLGYTAVPIDVDPEVAQALRAERIEIAFNALHGRYGEDGAIQGTLEVMRIPYTGSGILASALGMDKIASHDLFQSHGIPVPPFQVLTEEALSGFRADGLSFGFPVVVKPAMEGSSVKFHVTQTAAQEAEPSVEEPELAGV